MDRCFAFFVDLNLTGICHMLFGRVFFFSLSMIFLVFFFLCKANLFLPMENTAFWLISVVFDLE